MNKFKKSTLTAIAAAILMSTSAFNVYADQPENPWGPADKQPNQIVNDDGSGSADVEIPVNGFVGNDYNSDHDNGLISKINVSVPLNMKFAIVGNLIGDEKFTTPEYEVINSGKKDVNITLTKFEGEGDFVPVVEASQVNEQASPDEGIALNLQLEDSSPVALKTGFEGEESLGTVAKNNDKTLKFTHAKYGKDFSKFKRAEDNKNTNYKMTWKIAEVQSE